MIWNIRKKYVTFNQNRKKKQEFKKMNSVRRLWDIFKCAIIQIIGMQNGEEKEQEIEKLI